MIGCKRRSSSIFRSLMLVTGTPNQIPQSYVITSWTEHLWSFRQLKNFWVDKICFILSWQHFKTILKLNDWSWGSLKGHLTKRFSFFVIISMFRGRNVPDSDFKKHNFSCFYYFLRQHPLTSLSPQSVHLLYHGQSYKSVRQMASRCFSLKNSEMENRNAEI